MRVRSNEQIRVPQVRLIGATGEPIGVVTIQEALLKAQEAELDLVEVAATAKPPVCRIIDLGKYIYSINKKEKESKKKQKVVYVKEIKLTPKIEEHDFQTKLRHGRDFIERGDKVKLSMMFRGREITHMDLGRKILERYKKDLSDVAEIERDGRLEGNLIHIYFSPMTAVKKNALKKAQMAAEEQKKIANQAMTAKLTEEPKNAKA
ncbi:MAG: translation initiation factor IF-3 [Candidatus Omnitrophica bacterium]|nr:translation initiation factor IF-3 [Candidatus Omnitrophota bacterium]